jgi:hypothetical protein
MIKSASSPIRAIRAIRAIWAVLSLFGLVLPWWFNLRYFAEGGGLAPAAFFGAAMVNPLTTAITVDVYLTAVAFSVAVVFDREAGARRWWALPLTFLVGLSFALLGYLWWRSAPRSPGQVNGL